jgi:hypothetical protein
MTLPLRVWLQLYYLNQHHRTLTSLINSLVTILHALGYEDLFRLQVRPEDGLGCDDLFKFFNGDTRRRSRIQNDRPFHSP